jgi:hypothetical protein
MILNLSGAALAPEPANDERSEYGADGSHEKDREDAGVSLHVSAPNAIMERLADAKRKKKSRDSSNHYACEGPHKQLTQSISDPAAIEVQHGNKA